MTRAKRRRRTSGGGGLSTLSPPLFSPFTPSSPFSRLGLGEVPEREERPLHLPLRQLRQEVGLVLGRVGAQVEAGTAAVRGPDALRVVPRRDEVVAAP